MSGGGGGGIIRGAVIKVATLDCVTENITPQKKAKRDVICAKNDADITCDDMDTLWKCIRQAYTELE